MRECKIYLASALFICLSAVRLCFPQLPEQLRLQAGEILCNGRDYNVAVQAMGRALAHGQLEDQLVQVLEYIGPPEEQALAVGETWDSPFPGGAAATAEKDASGASQAADSVLPDNVCSDSPLLPFEYSSPASGELSSCFGFREDPIDAEPGFHYGIDIAADSGDDILAFASGLVSFVGTGDGYGNYCIIEHTGGYSTLYAHLSQCLVSEGQDLEKGQLIGCAGQSGRATGPHLHFELMYQDKYINPEYYI